MTDSTFPISNATATKEDLRAWVQGISGASDYVKWGFTLTATGGLNVSVASGEAYGGGARMTRTAATPLTLVDGATNHVFVTIDENAPDTLVFHVDQDDTPPATPYVKLAVIPCTGGAVVSITHVFRTVPISGWGEPY